jgi:hypothetical protein
MLKHEAQNIRRITGISDPAKEIDIKCDKSHKTEVFQISSQKQCPLYTGPVTLK